MTDTVPEPAEPDEGVSTDRALALIRVLRAKIAAAAEANAETAPPSEHQGEE
jgi:hypothetical protein